MCPAKKQAHGGLCQLNRCSSRWGRDDAVRSKPSILRPAQGWWDRDGDSDGDSDAGVLHKSSARRGVLCPEPTSASSCLLIPPVPTVTGSAAGWLLGCPRTLAGSMGRLQVLPAWSVIKAVPKIQLSGRQTVPVPLRGPVLFCFLPPWGCTVWSQNHCLGMVAVE